MKPAAGCIVLMCVALSGCCGTCCRKCSLSSSAKKHGGETSIASQNPALGTARQGVRVPSASDQRVADAAFAAPSPTGPRAVNDNEPEPPRQTSLNRFGEIPSPGVPSAQMTVPPPPLDADQSLPSLSDIAKGSKAPSAQDGWNTADSDLPSVDTGTSRQTIGVTDTIPRSAYTPRAD